MPFFLHKKSSWPLTKDYEIYIYDEYFRKNICDVILTVI